MLFSLYLPSTDPLTKSQINSKTKRRSSLLINFHKDPPTHHRKMRPHLDKWKHGDPPRSRTKGPTTTDHGLKEGEEGHQERSQPSPHAI
ncbi:hypothetical protein B9Z55_027362 [Caenorhabditis nigoni]|uniref:Uncharacterized protein n=1 Tax=Caenorhabditis nigoni TaxID=1611254 RepID=A0A2G5SGR8_9PELO|nr:hypothetical protein B9Z55_027362 [Caenorhabditis nigoni]